ncbi:hypothetical protein K443DRAFT_15438 [Laccaria amethystina LaAM-08-1]|uniref:Uncharacterized protein n=1 Tax=Laccaria amethystina LaAM-08-1 TaxID=1095629 RepID=A0A0C9WLD2_9AGAR|nr:hypothetical protein K443DRAFT_15438 [Laccaria amethystina LaAM-08-1]
MVDSAQDRLNTAQQLQLGNVTGYPGVFQSNPCLYPSKPVPASMSAGFRGVMPPKTTNEPCKSSASVN